MSLEAKDDEDMGRLGCRGTYRHMSYDKGVNIVDAGDRVGCPDPHERHMDCLVAAPDDFIRHHNLDG